MIFPYNNSIDAEKKLTYTGIFNAAEVIDNLRVILSLTDQRGRGVNLVHFIFRRDEIALNMTGHLNIYAKLTLKSAAVLLAFVCIQAYPATGTFLSSSPRILLIKNDFQTTSQQMLEDIQSFGYSVTEVIPDLITPEIVEQHDLSILSTGTNADPCQNSFLRNILIEHANDGGKILVEGGENGYVGIVFPGYAAFSNKVLKISAWNSHIDDTIRLNPAYEFSAIASFPNKLMSSVRVTSFTNFYQDVCSRMENSIALYGCSGDTGSGGVIVFPDPDQPQIINMCFSYNAVPRSFAKDLLANSLNALVGSPVGISVTTSEIPDELTILGNYPNPFNSTTTIMLSLPRDANAALTVYDSGGREVSTIFRKYLKAGIIRCRFDATDLASGIYFLELVSGIYKSSHTIVITK